MNNHDLKIYTTNLIYLEWAKEAQCRAHRKNKWFKPSIRKAEKILLENNLPDELLIWEVTWGKAADFISDCRWREFKNIW